MDSNSGNDNAGGAMGGHASSSARPPIRRGPSRNSITDIPNQRFDESQESSGKSSLKEYSIRRKEKRPSPYERETLASTSNERQILGPSGLLDVVINRNRTFQNSFMNSDMDESVSGEETIRDILSSMKKLYKLKNNVNKDNVTMHFIIKTMQENTRKRLINIMDKEKSKEVASRYIRDEVKEIIGPIEAIELVNRQSFPEGAVGGSQDISAEIDAVLKEFGDLSILNVAGDSENILKEIEKRFSTIGIKNREDSKAN